MARDEPDRLYIRRKDRETYAIILDRGSPLAGAEAKVVFLMAMLTGFMEGKELELGSQREGYFRTEYLTDAEKSVIKAIAVQREGGLEVLADKKKVYAIAEGYAAGGLESLKNRILGEHGSYEKELELLLTTSLERNGIGGRSQPSADTM